jgi:hypothetical protein
MDHLSRSKKSTIPQSTIGGLFVFGESGEYSTFKGVGRHGQLVTGRSILMGPPALTQ